MNKTLDIDYISFGRGSKTLIIIPGISDGVMTVKNKGFIYSYIYKVFKKDYKVYIISRRNDLKEGCTTKDFSLDIFNLMNMLNIEKADILGISQGGMIAQCFAINYPEKVNKLVLAITAAKPNSIMENTINNWIDLINKKDFKGIFLDTVDKSYTMKNKNKYRRLYSILYRVINPKNYNRFLIQAKSCLEHNAYDELDKIKCDTFIIGASEDKILGVDASYEIHNKIKNSSIYIFEGYGHGVFAENKNFTKVIKEFFDK